MISPIGWFFIIYLSLGIFFLMDGIVYAWDNTNEYSTLVKILGTIIAVVMWPTAFM